MSQIRSALTKQNNAEALPIKFYRVEPGMYEAPLQVFTGPWACEYRIHRTEHRGYGSSHTGRVRWHIQHVPTGQNPFCHRDFSYALSLTDVIDRLHTIIGSYLRGAFSILADMNAEAERELAWKRTTDAARCRLEDKIRGAVDAWRNHPQFSDEYGTLVTMIADAVQA